MNIDTAIGKRKTIIVQADGIHFFNSNQLFCVLVRGQCNVPLLTNKSKLRNLLKSSCFGFVPL